MGKKTRADHLIEVCHRLNNKVYVDKLNSEITEEECLKYDVVIFCDVYDIGRILDIDKFIRSQKNAKTVVMFAMQMGFFGLFATDFGDEWEMFNSGVEFPKINITGISSEERGRVVTAQPHGYKTGDFVVIKYVEGMKYVNDDARPITVLDETSFLIEDTRNFGHYLRGGICEKVDLVEKIRSPPLEDQLVQRHSESMLFAKAVIAYYQDNSRLPGLFDESAEESTMKLLRTLGERIHQKFEESKGRNFIKVCEYSFYPLVYMLAATISLEVVKCTGKYRPITSPLVIDWSGKITFEVKKKMENQINNIIDSSTLEKLAQLQYSWGDVGWASSTTATKASNSSTSSTPVPSPNRTASCCSDWRASVRARSPTD